MLFVNFEGCSVRGLRADMGMSFVGFVGLSWSLRVSYSFLESFWVSGFSGSLPFGLVFQVDFCAWVWENACCI